MKKEKYPWDRSDYDRNQMINGLMKLSNSFGGLRHRSIIWLYREYYWHKNKARALEEKVKEQNEKIKTLSIELSKLKRNKD